MNTKLNNLLSITGTKSVPEAITYVFDNYDCEYVGDTFDDGTTFKFERHQSLMSLYVNIFSMTIEVYLPFKMNEQIHVYKHEVGMNNIERINDMKKMMKL